MLSTRQAKSIGAMCAVLLLFATLLISLNRRAPRIVARYSSDGRADGGYMLTLDAAGYCQIKANHGGLEFESQGRYRIEGNQCILETRPRPSSALAALLAWRLPVSRETNWLARTNGAEYLVSPHRYARFAETGNTNLLHDQMRRVE